MRTCCITYTASGTGMTSFLFPIAGTITAIYAATQATSACVSFSGVSLATGVQGSDGTIIAFMAGAGASGLPAVTGLSVAVKVNQTVYIDVKTAATFGFVVSR